MKWVAIVFLTACLAAMLRLDWPLLRGPRRFTLGRVTGHRRSTFDADETFAAIVTFTDHRGRVREAVDDVFWPHGTPPVGATLRVVYLESLPEQARVYRPWLRLMIYGFILGTSAVLIGWAD